MFIVPLTSEPNQTFRCTVPVNGQNMPFEFTLRYNSEAEYWISKRQILPYIDKNQREA